MTSNRQRFNSRDTLKGKLFRLASFAETPDGGNPAGVWIGDSLPLAEDMQKIANNVGYSETAFVSPTTGSSREVRYFSPEAEVPFCGHATIALGAVIGKDIEQAEIFTLETPVGEVPVSVSRETDGLLVALTSVETRNKAIKNEDMKKVLAILGWRENELCQSIPPAIAFAGAWHLIIAVQKRERLQSLDYQFEALKSLMLELDLTTLQLVWRESAEVMHSRNPFPVGGVIEDPATGASAAALAGYLRDTNIIETPNKFIIKQGEDMGSPSIIHVSVPDSGGITLSGRVVSK